MQNRIIFFSGGIASFTVAAYIKETYPGDNIVLYFTDTQWESEDLYRFINEASDKLELPMLTHSSGMNPMQLMFEKKMVYNNRIADCSKLLKVRVASDFLKKGITPKIEKWRNKDFLKHSDFSTEAILYFGIDWTEAHRQKAMRENWRPFKTEFPLVDNFIDYKEVLRKHNIKQPVLYDLGFSHNNCNARCVKAGQGHYKNFKDKMPHQFKKIMEQEHHLKMYVSAYRYITKGNDPKDKKPIPEEDRIPLDVQEIMLAELDDAYRDYFYDRVDRPKLYIHPASSASTKYMRIQQYAFMKKTEDKAVRPYPIRDLHYEVENEIQIDLLDIGGCGCFLESEELECQTS